MTHKRENGWFTFFCDAKNIFQRKSLKTAVWRDNKMNKNWCKKYGFTFDIWQRQNRWMVRTRHNVFVAFNRKRMSKKVLFKCSIWTKWLILLTSSLKTIQIICFLNFKEMNKRTFFNYCAQQMQILTGSLIKNWIRS